MGTPLPENPVGEPCPNCWGPGKPFGIESTPEILTIQLFDLEEGFFWDPNIAIAATFPTQLFQTGLPCIWHAETLAITWDLALFVDDTLLTVTDIASGSFIFSTTDNDPCIVSGPSDITGPNGVFAFNGTFALTFSEVFT